MSGAPARRPAAAVGIVCFRADEVLMIRRGAPPLAGEWSLPGGRIEWGETASAAARRELREETGVEASDFQFVAMVDGIFRRRSSGEVWAHYVLIDFVAQWAAGEPRADSDAAHAEFMPMARLPELNLWAETLRVIEQARAMAG